MVGKTKTVFTLDEQGQMSVPAWLDYIQQKLPTRNLSLLKQAIFLAQLSGEHHATPNGDSCLHQGFVMVETLAEINADDNTLVAAMVYSSLRYSELSLEDIREPLGEKVAKLVSGTEQMEAIHHLQGQAGHLSNTIDNLRKMLLAMANDVRVVLIKLAERCAVLMNCGILMDSERLQIAKETMDLYAPLANRLGVGHMKWLLEDLSFRYLDPSTYKEISTSLKIRRSDREDYLTMIKEALTHEINKLGIEKYEITGRVKHINSIYRKMKRKHLPIEEIYDITALRILVPEVQDCYQILGQVHARWPHVTKEFDDYIAKPKPNGYRSIHTAIVGPDDRHVEIQIRTFTMDEESEKGVAAHWVYKEGGRKSVEQEYEEKIAWLRQVMEWQKELTAKGEQAEAIQTQIFDDRVYVFTPNGDVVDLEKGATPIDFAYHIHSEIGNHCRGAKINGHLVQLTYHLKTGDRVDIITVKEGGPSRDWLNPHAGYIVTARAKAKIHHYFRKLDYDKNLAEGHEIFDKELKKLALKKLDYKKIAERLNLHSKDDLFAGIGRGDVKIHAVLTTIHDLYEPEEVKPLSIPIKKVTTKTASTLRDIDVQGIGNVLTHMAKCCKPVPGDDIVGYITIGRGVSIHRRDCANLLKKTKDQQPRIIEVNWGGKTKDKYEADLIITANERPDLVKDISNQLVAEKISILAMTAHPMNNQVSVYLTIEIDNNNPLGKVMTKLNHIADVLDIKRV